MRRALGHRATTGRQIFSAGVGIDAFEVSLYRRGGTPRGWSPPASVTVTG